MPGYGVVYLPFRLIFSQAAACNILIVLQFLFAGISVYYLALTAKTVFKSNKIFYVCFYLFLVSTYSNYYDGWLLTESFCCSALIFSVWFFVKYYEDKRTQNLLFSGILLTWAIFLRPVFLPLIFVFLFVLSFPYPAELINLPAGKKGNSIKSFLLLLLPLLVAEGWWIARNCYEHKKLIVLTSASLAPRAENIYESSLFDFIHSWGGSADFTDTNSALHYFGFHLGDMPSPKNYKESLPGNIYTSQFNKDSLIWLKNKITALNDSIILPDIKQKYRLEVKEKLERYTVSVKEEKPTLYYLEAPFLHCLPRFLFGYERKLYTRRFQIPGKIGLLTEYIFAFYYCLILVLGVVGACLLSFKGLTKIPLVLIITGIPIYTILVHAIVLRATSNRFLMPAWPFLVVCAAYVIVFAVSKKEKTYKTITLPVSQS
jgi:hypothetical protein